MRGKMLGTAMALALVNLGAPDWAPARDAGKSPATAQVEAPFVHVVILHLKSDAPEGEADALIRDAYEMLRPIPTIRGLKAGKKVTSNRTDRPVAKFDVGLVVLFENEQGMKTYLNHPNHLKYVAKHLKYVEADKLGIFDFAEPKK